MGQDARGAGGEVADGSDRSVPPPDVSARDWTRTRTSDATEPPPPVDVAVVEAVHLEAVQSEAGQVEAAPVAAVPVEAAQVEARQVEARQASARPASDPPPGPVVSYGGSPKAAVRSAGTPRRPPLVVQGVLAGAVGGLLALAAWGGTSPLLLAVLVLQVGLVLSVLTVLDAPAATGAAVVAVGAAAAADALVLLDDGEVDRVAGVVGLSLVAALLHQLVRRSRSRVTESLADTLLAVVVVAGAACLLALAALDGGRELLLLGLGAAAAVLVVGRLTDRVLPGLVLATGATRSWPGLLLGLAAGIGAALLAAQVGETGVSTAAAALVGLAAALTVATADLAVDLGAAELRPGRRDARRVSALRPAAALLPYALLGPVALLAGRLVLS